MDTQEYIRIAIRDYNASRYEVPLSYTAGTAGKSLYTISVTDIGSPFGFVIRRTHDDSIVFDCRPVGDVAPLVYEDQYLRVSTSIQGMCM